MYNINVRAIIIAHNQLDAVKRLIKTLKTFSGMEEEQLIVVDNASEDGLRNFLESQTQMDYIICEDEPAGYAEILNEAIRQFISDEDVLMISPNLVTLPGSVDILYTALHESESIGAVSPQIISYDTEAGSSFSTAVTYATEHIGEHTKREIMGLPYEAVLIRNEMINRLYAFDERLIFPDSTMVDFAFRGMGCQYHYYEIENAFCYKIAASVNNYDGLQEIENDRSELKQKWGMNYFNQYPNKALLSLVVQEVGAEFNVLEIGCDSGVNLLHLKNQYPNVHLYGAEINPYAAGIAAHVAEVKVADIEEKILDFDGIKFDYIIFGDVLEHLRDPEGVMQYCRTMLKENGRVLACIPNLMHYSVMRDLLNGNFTYADTGLLDRTHVHFFTYNEICRMIYRTGYEIETFTCKGTKEDASEEDREFVDKLTIVSGEAQEFMYYTFQYLVSAKLKV